MSGFSVDVFGFLARSRGICSELDDDAPCLSFSGSLGPSDNLLEDQKMAKELGI
jgi:hypothetical protein